MGFFTAENDGDTAAQRAEDDATITQFWAWWAETGLAATAEVFDADEPSDEALQEIGDKVGASLRIWVSASRAARVASPVTCLFSPRLATPNSQTLLIAGSQQLPPPMRRSSTTTAAAPSRIPKAWASRSASRSST